MASKRIVWDSRCCVTCQNRRLIGSTVEVRCALDDPGSPARYKNVKVCGDYQSRASH